MQEDSPCSILRLLAEVIKLKDTSMLSLELSVGDINHFTITFFEESELLSIQLFILQGIAAKYKDFNSDHGLALLALRGDMGRNDAKQVLCMLETRPRSNLMLCCKTSL